jgi:acetylornithine deacetylase
VNAIRQAVDACRDDLVAFAQRLVRTPSLPGEEAAVQTIAAAEMRRHDLETSVLTASAAELAAHSAYSDDGLPVETRPNVVGRWRAQRPTAGARSIILNGHLDVVSPGQIAQWSASPWSGTVDGRRLYGRGACDMKSGVACALFALAAIRRAGLAPGADVILETVSGEESGGVGTLTTIVRGIGADAAIILEPTRLRLCPVQAGALTFRITVSGRSAHAALKRSGVSAIDKMRIVLAALDELDAARHRTFAHPLYADPQQIAPISVGIMRSGDWPSSVPDEAVVEGRLGVFPGELVGDARRALASAIQAAAWGDEWLRRAPPRLEWFEGQFESGETPLDAPIVQAASAAHRAVTGTDPLVEGVTYGSDLRLFTNHAGIPAVLYGPGDVRQAHAPDEWIDLDEVVTACKVIALLVADWTRAT